MLTRQTTALRPGLPSEHVGRNALAQSIEDDTEVVARGGGLQG